MKAEKKQAAAKRLKESHTYLRGPLFPKPKKLINLALVLQKWLNEKEYSLVMDHFQNLLSRKQYIPCVKHKSCASHHSGLGPSNRPLKAYSYVLSFLKTNRPILQNKKQTHSFEVLTQRTGRMPKKPADKPRTSGGTYRVCARMVVRMTKK